MNQNKLVTLLHNRLFELNQEHQKLQEAFDETCYNHDETLLLLYLMLLEAKSLKDVKKMVKALAIERAAKKGYEVDSNGLPKINKENFIL